MTRRHFLALTSAAAVTPPVPRRLAVPVHRVIDSRVQVAAEKLRHFHSSIWPEAVRDFRSGGVDLDVTDGPGEVKISPADKPIFTGLRRDSLNVVVTGQLPLYWDQSRALAGMTTIHDGYHVCVLALRYAHGNQAAFLSVNTGVHEILHALLLDIFQKPPKWYQAGGREFRVDWYATRLWLFHDGAALRESGRQYVARLRRNARITAAARRE